jgi:hypothetical protein
MVDDFDSLDEPMMKVQWKTPYTDSVNSKQRANASTSNAIVIKDDGDDDGSRANSQNENAILVPDTPLVSRNITGHGPTSVSSTPLRNGRAASPDVIIGSSDTELPPSELAMFSRQTPKAKKFPKLSSLSASKSGGLGSLGLDLDSYKYKGADSDSTLWSSHTSTKPAQNAFRQTRPTAAGSHLFPDSDPSQSTASPPSMTPPRSRLPQLEHTSLGSPGADADLAQLMDMFPDADVGILRRALKDSNWDLSTAKHRMLVNGNEAEPPKPRSRLVKKANSSSTISSLSNDDVQIVSVTKVNAKLQQSSLLKRSSLAAKVKRSRKASWSDDDEGGYSSDDSADGRGSDGSEDDWEQNEKTLDFFNAATKKEFLDTIMCSEENADIIIGMRSINLEGADAFTNEAWVLYIQD